MSLDLNVYLQQFPDIFKHKFDRTYDFPSLEKRFAPLREGKRWLVAKDVAQVFLPQNTPFGRYWPLPNEKDLDRALEFLTSFARSKNPRTATRVSH